MQDEVKKIRQARGQSQINRKPKPLADNLKIVIYLSSRFFISQTELLVAVPISKKIAANRHSTLYAELLHSTWLRTKSWTVGQGRLL